MSVNFVEARMMACGLCLVHLNTHVFGLRARYCGCKRFATCPSCERFTDKPAPPRCQWPELHAPVSAPEWLWSGINKTTSTTP